MRENQQDTKNSVVDYKEFKGDCWISGTLMSDPARDRKALDDLWRGRLHNKKVHRDYSPGEIPASDGNHPRGITDYAPLFAGILPSDSQRIVAAARIKEFTRGESLFMEGDAVEQVALLTSGFVKISHFGKGGERVILRFCIPGDLIGAAALFSDGSHPGTAQAYSGCQALVWNESIFKGLVARWPVLHKNITALLGEELLELEERFHDVAAEEVSPRLARQLLRLMEKIGRPRDDGIEISLSRQELAQMIGTTLFTVSRLFSTWEARGIVKPRRLAVVVCDSQLLRALSS